MDSKLVTGKGWIGDLPPQVEEVSKAILDAAYKVHTALGPGLLESVYETCLVHELKLMGIKAVTQVSIPVKYEGVTIDSGLRLDLLAEDCIVVEIKAVENVLPLYKAQLLTYLKLTGTRLGLLINFNVIHLRDRIKRLVN